MNKMLITMPLLIIMVMAITPNSAEYHKKIENDVYEKFCENLDLIDIDSQCAGSNQVYFTTESKNAQLIDFEKSQGYAIVDNDYNVYLLEKSGDASNLLAVNNLKYNEMSGFFIESGDEVSYLSPIVSPIKNRVASIPQIEPIYGPDRLDDYISRIYGSKWQFRSEKYLEGISLAVASSSQFSYVPNENNYILVSIYKLMAYYIQQTNEFYAPTGSIRVMGTYSYKDDNGDIKETTIDKMIPELYSVIRSIAVSKYSYNAWNGLSGVIPGLSWITQTSDIINDTLKHFGVQGWSGSNYYVYNWANEIEGQILKKDRPIMFNLPITTGIYYNDQSILIYGYKIFQKKTTIAFITLWDYLHFAALADNEKGTVAFLNYDTNTPGGISFCSYTRII